MRTGFLRSLLFIAVIVVLATLLFACSLEVSDTEVYLSKVTVESSREGDYVVGQDIDLSEVVIKAHYSNGEVRTVPLTDDMLSAEDRDKFFTVGVHTITVTYKDKTAVFSIKVVDDRETKVYNARFFSNGGSDIPTQVTDTITEFLAPTREGYTFDGWYSAYDFSGSKAIAPYLLKKNTDFYAKWVDNRRCTVTFMDEGEVYDELQVVYGDSIDISDLNLFPAPPAKIGKTFSGWKLVSGSTVEIESDAVIEASYTNIICTVQITYWDDETDKIVENKPFLRNYSETFDVSSFTMPTEEGHSSRWVYYTQSDNYTAYHEMEGTEITVTESINIRPLHVINTYSVTIHNGIEESSQRDADLKSGDIKLEHIYSDPTTYTDFMVEYNNNFIISAYTQEPYLKTPRAMVGYNVYWCFVTTTLAGEIWRNTDNKVWNESTQSFEVLDGEEATTNFDLLDGEGNYVARVRDGDIYNVKGNVTIKAKYVKKKYTVRLYRLSGGNWEKIGEFADQVYRSDFKLYDPNIYADPSLSEWTDVESYYLKHNVVSWSKDDDVTDDWRSVYYNVDNSNPDDWAIEWYSASTQAQDKLVDFAESSGSLGYFEIRDNLDLYCKDIDLRRYSVYVKYNYNFATGEYDSVVDCGMLAENDPIDKQAAWEASITRYYPDHDNESVTYGFIGWYDYPYEPDGGGALGESYRSLDTRTHNMIYYAHYDCDTVYTVTINDKTQSTAYNGTSYQGKGYDVDEAIVYTVPAGTTFSLDMIYKGRDTLDGYLPGSGFYTEASFMYYVLGTGGKASPNGPLTVLYNEKLHEYDPDTDNYNVAVAALDALINNVNERINNYTLMLGKIYSYGYVDDASFTKAYFEAIFLSHDDYNDIRRQLWTYNSDKELLTTYAAQLALAESYYDKNEADASNGGLYKRYADSYIDLNAAYGKDVTDVNVKAKYRFAGWYTDPEYTELFIADYRDMDFSWFASNSYFAGRQNTQLNLYAKWADEEKGSEGLVFRAVYDNNGDQIGVVVVDYINKAEYEASAIYDGCGFNNFDQYEYSVNFNDSGVMPSDLGNTIEVQIPASHGGTGMATWPVLGILKDAFKKHGDNNNGQQKIVSIDLPDTIAFIEEGAFEGCTKLELIAGSGDEDYIYVSEQRVIYQWNDYAIVKLKDNGVFTAIDIASKSLIAYAPKVRGESIDKTTLTVRAGTVIISDYAFYGASDLLYVSLSDALVSIGVSAFENSGLSGTEVGNGNKLVLPATLTTIKDYAFRNCPQIKAFEGGTGLVKIGREALSTTGWYTAKRGLIALNNIVVGLGEPDPADLDKDGGVTRITVINGVNKVSYTNDFGVVYYDAEGGSSITDVVLDSSVTGIADYAFCPTDSNRTSQIKTVTIQGTLNNGVSEYAFRNCANLTDVYAQYLSNTSVLDHTAFVGAGKVTIHVTDISALDISWSSYGDVTVTEY